VVAEDFDPLAGLRQPVTLNLPFDQPAQPHELGAGLISP
jgi:hypothetical protein